MASIKEVARNFPFDLLQELQLLTFLNQTYSYEKASYLFPIPLLLAVKCSNLGFTLQANIQSILWLQWQQCCWITR